MKCPFDNKGRLPKTLVIVLIMLLTTTLPGCRNNHETPIDEPIMMSGTLLWADSMVGDFHRYYNAVTTGADAEYIQEAADVVMSIIRSGGAQSWAIAMYDFERETGAAALDILLDLIASHMSNARNAGDEHYDTALAEAMNANLHEAELQILQWLYERVAYLADR